MKLKCNLKAKTQDFTKHSYQFTILIFVEYSGIFITCWGNISPSFNNIMNKIYTVNHPTFLINIVLKKKIKKINEFENIK